MTQIILLVIIFMTTLILGVFIIFQIFTMKQDFLDQLDSISASTQNVAADVKRQADKIDELVLKIEEGGLTAVEEAEVLEALKAKAANLAAVAAVVPEPIEEPEEPTEEPVEEPV